MGQQPPVTYGSVWTGGGLREIVLPVGTEALCRWEGGSYRLEWPEDSAVAVWVQYA